jgi:hypothetical protein
MERTDTDRQFPTALAAKVEPQMDPVAAKAEAETHINELKREEEKIELEETKSPIEQQHKADALLVAALMGNSIAKFKSKSKYKSQLSAPAGSRSVKPTFTIDEPDGVGISFKQSKSVSDNHTHEIELDSRVDLGKLNKTNTTIGSSSDSSKPNTNAKANILIQKAFGSKPSTSINANNNTTSSSHSRVMGSKASKCIIIILRSLITLN